MNNNIYLITGIFSGLYSFYAFYKYLNIQNELLTISEANKLIEKGYFKFIIDVRTKKEWNKGHYKNVIHIPLNTLNKSKIDQLTQNQMNTPMLIYCRTGRRAKLAIDLIKSYGYDKVNYINEDYTNLV